MEPYYQGGSSVAEHMMNEDGGYLPRFDVRDGQMAMGTTIDPVNLDVVQMSQSLLNEQRVAAEKSLNAVPSQAS